MVRAEESKEVQGQTTPGTQRWLFLLLGAGGVLAFLSLAAGGLLVVAASQFASTTITRRSFATEAEAVSFVSDHLPAPLPSDAVVEELRYDRFTDWHLEARVDLGSAAAAAAYLARARAAGVQNPDYCGAGDGNPRELGYFLAAWSACGTVAPGAEEGVLEVTCFTR